MKTLPDTLDAARYRVAYRGDDKVYMGVSTLNGEPVEIFCSFDAIATHETTYMHAAWNIITRLTSICLQSEDVTLEDIIKQCERSSMKEHDAPGVLMEVLKKYVLPEWNEKGEDNLELAEKLAGKAIEESRVHAKKIIKNFTGKTST